MNNHRPIIYTLGRFILGPIFKFYYKPTIIGKENIPETGSVILASNHIHLFDQCHLIVSSKRYITYMAKKEYFDNWKTRWFFKSVGCIPVDRTKKDDEAVAHALEVLNNGGCIGIFPEGTRNALKDEKIEYLYHKYFRKLDYNYFHYILKKRKVKLSQVEFLIKLYEKEKISKRELEKYIVDPDKYLLKLIDKNIIKLDDYYNANILDLKFGTVSMAKKTESMVLPICITGNYRFRSDNLIVNIGKPFKIGNMDLVKANDKLKYELIKLMKQNLKEELNKK